jgi:TP901-1 family phage major tail protein
MTAQRGRDLLIKIGDGGSPETFVSVAGLRATSLAFNAQMVDITNADSTNMWRELLEGGIKSASLSGNGVFRDTASDASLRQTFFDGTTANYQVVIPAFGTLTGPFRITQLQYDGPYDGEVKVSLALASAGAPTFTVA